VLLSNDASFPNVGKFRRKKHFENVQEDVEFGRISEMKKRGLNNGDGWISGLCNRPAFFKKWLFSNFNKGFQYVNSMQLILLQFIHTRKKLHIEKKVF
jgi:hypothetical protein